MIKYCVVAFYDHANFARGDVISKHATHALAEAAIKRGPYETFRGIEERNFETASGRPQKLEDGKRRNIYIDEESWQKAKELGDGKPSEGIRRALKNLTVTKKMVQ